MLKEVWRTVKKKRYTKPVVIDLGKQSPDTINDGLLSWNRNGSAADKTESCADGVPDTACCNANDQTAECCVKGDSQKT
jgi:hypothetical protein